MNDWKEVYYKFIEQDKSLLFIEDSDNILLYDDLISFLFLKNIIIINPKTSLELRIEFELKIKNEILADNRKYIIKIDNSYPIMPDIFQYGYKLKILLSDIFKLIDTNVIKDLSSIYFNDIMVINEKQDYKLNTFETIESIFKNLYNINIDDIKSIEQVITNLINLHSITFYFNCYLHNILIDNLNHFQNIINFNILNKEDFNNFLINEIIQFVSDQNNKINFNDRFLIRELKNYFITGKIKPIKVNKEIFEKSSIKECLYYDEKEYKINEINSLKDYLKNIIPECNKIEKWFDFVKSYSKLFYLAYGQENVEIIEDIKIFDIEINKKWTKFLRENFNNIQSLSPYYRPYSVNQILNYFHFNKIDKFILIVIDCMNLWQWCMLKEKIIEKGIDIKKESSIIAWLPTVTSLSRQAIFRGAEPQLLKENYDEEKIFKEFWENKGFHPSEIKHNIFSVTKQINKDELNYFHKIGLVTNDIDDIVHSNFMGNSKLFKDTKDWIESFFKIFDELLLFKEKGYNIYITSDHGNVESYGLIKYTRNQNFGSKSRGKRYINFYEKNLLDDFIKSNIIDFKYNTINNSLYIEDNHCFDEKDKINITHGGGHIFEVLVPFIEL
jgi:hypothetical protein